MREMRYLSLGVGALVVCVALIGCVPVSAAQRRWSKFGVPEIYLKSADELGSGLNINDAANSFQNLLVQTAGPSVYERFRLAAEALFSVTLRLQSLLEDISTGQRSNFMVSPIAVTASLGQLALGTRGDTHRQLGELLSLPGQAGRSDRKRSVMQLHLQLGGLLEILRGGANARDFDLLAASALFTSPNIKLYTRFRRETTQIYGTQVMQVDFRSDPESALRRMNAWVAQHSRGFIQTAMPTPPPRDTTGVLVNSVFLRAAWRLPFDRSFTSLGTFRPTLGSQVSVPFMRGHFNLAYSESDRLRLRLLSIPYKRSDVVFYLLIPYDTPNEDYDIHNLTSKLNAPDVIDLLTKMRSEPIHIQMPRLVLQHTFSLREPLARYQRQFRQRFTSTRQRRETYTKTDASGCTCTCTRPDPPAVTNRFGIEGAQSQLNPTSESPPGGDLYFNMSNASNDPRFQIYDLAHPMYLEVAEDMGPVQTPSTSRVDNTRPGERFIKVDRPFTFFIRHESTLATLFWGTIVDPSTTKGFLG